MTDAADFPPDQPADLTPAVPPISTLDDLRTHLWAVHKTTVGTDDPILMLHTIHRVVLAEHDRQLAQHQAALADALGESVRTFTDDVRAAIEDFKDETLGQALRERLAAMTEAARLADASQAAFRRLLRVVVVLTLVNGLTVAAALLILFTILR